MQEGRPIKASSKPQPSAQRRILIVEDNIDGARMLALFFAGLGHKVEYAINAIVGLDIAHRFLPEFVFIDLKLPDGHGADLARQIRRNPRMSGARIYAISGSLTDDDRQRALAAGCEVVLEKPVDTKDLEALLARG